MQTYRQFASENRGSVTVFKTAEEAAQAVAELFLAKVQVEPEAVLGLATGQTPKRVYSALIDACRAGRVSFARATTFNLDEYCGLAASHPDSFAAYMHRELFGKADFSAEKINLLDGSAADMAAEAARYAALLKSHSIDVQLLGLGTNGHIGFNEPGSSAESRVRVVDLKRETLDANRPTLLELDEVPAQAVTMGIADILDAREIVMLATGAAKADAVRQCLEDKPNPECPGSLLAAHRNVQWFLDEAAASKLQR